MTPSVAALWYLTKVGLQPRASESQLRDVGLGYGNAEVGSLPVDPFDSDSLEPSTSKSKSMQHPSLCDGHI